jgi:hypothetical protein
MHSLKVSVQSCFTHCITGLVCSSFLATDTDNTEMTIYVHVRMITILEISQI